MAGMLVHLRSGFKFFIFLQRHENYTRLLRRCQFLNKRRLSHQEFRFESMLLVPAFWSHQGKRSLNALYITAR